VLCGGSGTRLWPISRTLMPKQFVKLFSNKSLFQLTIERNSKVCDKNFIVSNAEQYFLAKDQLEENSDTIPKEQGQFQIPNSQFLLEPVARNTAPAIALSCIALDPEEIVLVTPSDHLIKDEEEYEKVLKKAQELAQQDNLVTFGITPTFPETGFGYIESENTYDVKAFYEKPDLETATKYLEDGNFYWNSGMFCFKAGVFLEELKKYSPSIYEASKIAFENKQLITNNQLRITHEFMSAIPENSIDYAVMEKSNKVKVVPSNIAWSDVGSFDALADELPNDENNNLILSNKEIHTIDIKDLIIVDTDDALLICKKGSSQKVKDVVTKLKKENIELTNIHQTGHRPWGTYTVLEDSPGYKIKRIEVKPGCRLSLQKHFHRNEHWIVVSGCATVTIEDNTFILNPNESTYIKAGQLHRLENQGKLPLIIIEAQVGEYTGEDDIVRIDDDFKRD
jgi:mannose-1-phosphate guanylyltransferase